MNAPISDPSQSFADNFNFGPYGGYANPESFVDVGDPGQTFLGFPVHAPFGIPAGPLLNSKYVNAALRRGFDIVTYKTQRNTTFEANAYPNILKVETTGDVTLEIAEKPVVGRPFLSVDASKRSAGSIPYSGLTVANSFGNASFGPNFWVPDLKRAIAHEGSGQLLIMSVVGTIMPDFSVEDYYDDFAAVASRAAGTGVKAIEINLSCPNVAGEEVLCYTPISVEKIALRTKEAIGATPLVAKLGYFSQDQEALLAKVVARLAPYVSAISAINTIPAQIVDRQGAQAMPGEGRRVAGISGAGIKWAGLEMTRRLAVLRKKRGYKYEIIGIGGVVSPSDYNAYRAAGADAVQSATGAMWDSELAAKIKLV